MMAITVILKASIATCREERALPLCGTDSCDATYQVGGIHLRGRERGDRNGMLKWEL